MQLTRNGLTFSVDDHEVSRLVLERFNGIEAKLVNASSLPPRIGAEWKAEGGIYAGVMRGRDGDEDYYLIAGPEHADEISWQPAIEWADELEVDGCNEFTLPYRKEQALLFANVPELFKPTWYWSCEPHASSSDYAWGQGFRDGSQSSLSKDDSYRVRAVRRVPIQ